MKKFVEFKEAREYVRSLGIKSVEEYNELHKSGKIPHSLPSAPYRTYKGKGWKGWGDWIGTDKKKYNLSDNQVKAIKKKGKKSLKSNS